MPIISLTHMIWSVLSVVDNVEESKAASIHGSVLSINAKPLAVSTKYWTVYQPAANTCAELKAADTCQVSGCPEFASDKSGRGYCHEHRCHEPSCQDQRAHDSKSCDAHSCYKQNCHKERANSENALYCSKHECKTAGCRSGATVKGGHCVENGHACRTGACPEPRAYPGHDGDAGLCARHLLDRMSTLDARSAREMKRLEDEIRHHQAYRLEQERLLEYEKKRREDAEKEGRRQMQIIHKLKSELEQHQRRQEQEDRRSRDLPRRYPEEQHQREQDETKRRSRQSYQQDRGRARDRESGRVPEMGERDRRPYGHRRERSVGDDYVRREPQDYFFNVSEPSSESSYYGGARSRPRR
ncbi:hypothetical protein UCREL1_6935 [Eutypa lata UCREL1]|uniref:Uncharacterized protein n=1 Tax=Eutypa lata (strain UCR-EL1) TaxID=1287681 RepID=M7SPC6_EUTLA|nr:hypothetical protein UCREL1_6935 [Eutypa lata UCREL1]